MAARTGSRRWWTLALLPAMVVTGCGGSRLSHDAVVTAVNGNPLAATQVQQPVEQQQLQQGAVSSLPQGAAAPGVPGSGTATSSGGAALGTAARNAAPTAGYTGGTPRGGVPVTGGTAGTGSTAAAPAGPLSPIVLGNVGTYSGPIGSSTAGGDTTIQVWAHWTNAHGGINGHPVQVYTADDGGDPQRSLSLVKDMVENKHVIAFVSCQLPLDADSDLRYLHQHNIPIIGGDHTTPTWTSDSLAFPVGTTIGEVIGGTYKTAHQRGDTKLALVYCVEAPACSFVHDYTVGGGAAKAGETLVYNSQVSIAQPDYTAQCIGAQSAGANVVFIALEGAGMGRFAASCSRQNYHPLYIATSYQTTLGMEGNKDLEGLVAAAQDFPWMVDTPATAQFHQAVQQYAPNLRLSGAATVAWASGMMLAKAIAHVGPHPTPQDFLEGLWTMRNETLGGLIPPLTYVRNGPALPVQCFYVIELKGGRFSAPSGDAYSC